MNLVQKLPIGLSLACLMFMSSCSKEDALTPEPQTEIVTGHSNLKETGPGLLISIPHFPSTKGPTGLNVFPQDWVRDYPAGQVSLEDFPNGTSNLTHLWGDPMLPWKKSLPAIPNANSIVNFGSIVTNTTNFLNDYTTENYSTALTKITNLKPGKKYEITFYVSSTVCNVKQNAFTPSYAKTIYLSLLNVKNSYSETISMEGKEAEWVKKTVKFEAVSSETKIRFQGMVYQKGQYSYVHMFVDKNAIKEVN